MNNWDQRFSLNISVHYLLLFSCKYSPGTLLGHLVECNLVHCHSLGFGAVLLKVSEFNEFNKGNENFSLKPAAESAATLPEKIPNLCPFGML